MKQHNFDRDTCSVCGQHKKNVHTCECPDCFVTANQLIQIQLGKVNFVDGTWISTNDHVFQTCSGSCKNELCIPCEFGINNFCIYCRCSGKRLTTKCYGDIFPIEYFKDIENGKLDFTREGWVTHE